MNTHYLATAFLLNATFLSASVPLPSLNGVAWLQWENFFINSSFCTLFVSVLFYWVKTAFSFSPPFQAPPGREGRGAVLTPSGKKNKVASDSSPLIELTFSYLGVTASPAPAISPAPGMQGPSRASKGTFWSFIRSSNFGSMTMILSNLFLSCLLISRWRESGHFPLSNLWESLMFLSWSCTVIHLILEYKTASLRPLFKGEADHAPAWLPQALPLYRGVKKGRLGYPSAYPNEKRGGRSTLLTKLIGSITSPCALFTNAFATFSLPLEMQKASPLVPALQSNWLMMHVTVMIISYSALILGSLLSIAFLILGRRPKQSSSQANKEGAHSLAKLGPPLKTPLEVKGGSGGFQGEFFFKLEAFKNFYALKQEGAIGLYQKSSLPSPVIKVISLITGLLAQKELERGTSLQILVGNGAIQFSKTKNHLAWNFDNLSYRVVGIGFPFLTIGILSGAVWANEAWGSYWSWDPKETWALITWLIFALYLHARITKGWQGKKPAIIASFGFLAIWICFLGVNLIGEGLHSYGWFSFS